MFIVSSSLITRVSTVDQCVLNLVDGSSVKIPLPIIASSPHFLGADPEVQNAIDGLKPDDEKHRSFVEIEPITGCKSSLN